MSAQFEGLPDLRADLESAGFRLAHNNLAFRDNWCNWYAYRPSSIEAPECECNEGKRIQIIVYPHEFDAGDIVAKGAEVEVCGEAGGRWYKLRCYSINADKLVQCLPDIEASLIAAWSAINRDVAAKEKP